MTNQSLKKMIQGISLFLMILPFIFVFYLSLFPKGTDETLVEVLKSNPLLNISLIILFLLFFYGVIMIQFTKRYFDNHNFWAIGMEYLLIILTMVFVGARYYPLIIMVFLAFYYILKTNRIKVAEIIKFETLKQNWSQFHSGATIILCLVLILQILILARLK